MKTVCICGHFAFGEELLNGQTIKTKILCSELEKKFGVDEVAKVDTYGGGKRFLSMFLGLFMAMVQCKNVIILPAYKGVRVIAPFVVKANCFTKRRIHYVVIGGWLPKFLSDKPILSRNLKRFDHIYVETSKIKEEMDDLGFCNVSVMPNFKDISILKPEDMEYHYSPPYKLCIFSREITNEEIEDIVYAIEQFNTEKRLILYKLDIYGSIDSNYAEGFYKLCQQFPTYIRYMGSIDYDKRIEILQNYFALIIPTHYFTEDIPGIIIDAYSAGVPIIASRWESFTDIVDENVTGVGYSFDGYLALKEVLNEIVSCPQLIIDMKKACLTKAEIYTSRRVIDQLSFEKVVSYKLIKNIVIITKCGNTQNIVSPLRICTFSRVMKEKGIELVIEAVKRVNDRLGREAYRLDIYGQIDKNYQERFTTIVKSFPAYIKYMGAVPYDKSTEIIKSYFAILFLTYYQGEGFAGTLIDAMAAGVPVIASDWKCNKEVVVNGKTGMLINDVSVNHVADLLMKLSENQDEWNRMKKTSLEAAHRYSPETSIKPLLDNLDKK